MDYIYLLFYFVWIHIRKGILDILHILFVFLFSAGGTGVLINLDRVAKQMSELAPDVEVRGLADSGWFLDYPQYRYKDCVEASSCAPVDVTKWGIR